MDSDFTVEGKRDRGGNEQDCKGSVAHQLLIDCLHRNHLRNTCAGVCAVTEFKSVRYPVGLGTAAGSSDQATMQPRSQAAHARKAVIWPNVQAS